MLNSTGTISRDATQRASIKRFEDAFKGMSEPNSEIRPQEHQGWLTRVTAVLGEGRSTYLWVNGQKVAIGHSIPNHFEPKYTIHSVSILDHNSETASYSFVVGLRNLSGTGSETVMTFRAKNENEFMDWFGCLYSNCFAVMNKNALLSKANDVGRLIDRITDIRPLELTVGMARFIRQKFPGGLDEIKRFLCVLDDLDNTKSLGTRFSRDPPEVKEQKKWGRLLKYFLNIDTLRLSSGAAECGAIEAVLTLDLRIYPCVKTLWLRFVEVDNVEGAAAIENLHIDACGGEIYWFVNTKVLQVKACETLRFCGIYYMSHSLEIIQIHSLLKDEDLEVILRLPGGSGTGNLSARKHAHGNTAYLTAAATARATRSIPLAQRWINLHTLDLSHNILKNLPQEFEELRRLKTLVLDYNELVSLEHVRGLKSLIHISAKSNNLMTADSLVDMRNLTYLNLGSNQLREVNFDNLTNLISVDVSYNNLTDWRDIYALSLSARNLEVLHLEGNPLQRGIAKTDYVPVVRSMFTRKITLDGRRINKADDELLYEMLERYQDRVFTQKTQVPVESDDDAATTVSQYTATSSKKARKKTKKKGTRRVVKKKKRREQVIDLSYEEDRAGQPARTPTPPGITKLDLHAVAASTAGDKLKEWQANLPLDEEEQASQREAVEDDEVIFIAPGDDVVEMQSSPPELQPMVRETPPSQPLHATQPRNSSGQLDPARLSGRSTSSRLPEGDLASPEERRSLRSVEGTSQSADPLGEPLKKQVRARKTPPPSPGQPSKSPRLSGSREVLSAGDPTECTDADAEEVVPIPIGVRSRSHSYASVPTTRTRPGSMQRSVTMDPKQEGSHSSQNMWGEVAAFKQQKKKDDAIEKARLAELDVQGGGGESPKPGGYKVLEDTASEGQTTETSEFHAVVITQEMKDFAVRFGQPAKGACLFVTSGFMFILHWYKKYWKTLERREYALLQKILIVVCHLHLALVIPFAIIFAQLPCTNCTEEDSYNERRFRYFISVMIMAGSAFQTVLGIYALFYENIVMLLFFNLLTVVLAVRYMYNMFNYLEDNTLVWSVIVPPIFEICYELFYLGVSLLVWPYFNRLVFYRVGGGPHLVKIYKYAQVFAAFARTDLLFISLSAIIAAFWYITQVYEWVLLTLTCIAAIILYQFAVNWVIQEKRQELVLFVLLLLGIFGVQVYMIWTLSIQPDSSLRDRLKTAYHATIYTIIAALLIKVMTLLSLLKCVFSFGKGLRGALAGEIGDERLWGVPIAPF